MKTTLHGKDLQVFFNSALSILSEEYRQMIEGIFPESLRGEVIELGCCFDDFKRLKESMPIIESGFEKRYGRRVKVTIEVMSVKDGGAS